MVVKKSETGFTILELLIAIAVVGIIVPTLVGFMNTLNQLNDRARDFTLVNSFAENKIESLRSLGFTGVSEGAVDFSSELPATLGNPKSATYTVTTPNTGMRRVDITVTYNDHGKTQTLRYRTLIGELGVGQY